MRDEVDYDRRREYEARFEMHRRLAAATTEEDRAAIAKELGI